MPSFIKISFKISFWEGIEWGNNRQTQARKYKGPLVVLMDPKKKPILFCFRYYNEVELPRRAAEEHNKTLESNGPIETVQRGEDLLPQCSIHTDGRAPILKWY